MRGSTTQEARWRCPGKHVKKMKTKRVRQPNGSFAVKPVETRCVLCASGNCAVYGIGVNTRVRVQYVCSHCLVDGKPVYLCRKHGCFRKWHQTGAALASIDPVGV